MKSEPSAFSIDDLANAPHQTTPWDGVRNYQARNFMKHMQLGDLAYFYHSNCKVPGIVGIIEICKLAYPDFTALDKQDLHYDPKSTLEKPIWEMVEVRFKEQLPRLISLKELQTYHQHLDMPLLRKGNRLSIMPVTKEQWLFIQQL